MSLTTGAKLLTVVLGFVILFTQSKSKMSTLVLISFYACDQV